MTAEQVPEGGLDVDRSLLSPLRPGSYRGPETACPPEYADVPVRETLAAGFLSRPSSASPQPGSGFESGGVLDTSAPSGSLAGLTDAVTREGRLAELADDELIGVLRAWRRLESWSSAGTLAAAAELARRRPAGQTPAAARHRLPPSASHRRGHPGPGR
jgi:hypothetical protein